MEKGIPTYRGGRWTSKAVIKILHNEKYVGDLVQKKTYTPDYLTHEKKSNKGQVPLIALADHHEPIISREIWDMAQERLRRNNKHGAQMSGHSNRYVFSGKIKCGQCGSSFVGRFQSLKDGTMVRRWRCGTATAHGRTGCDVGRLVRDDDAIQMLKTAFASLSVDRDDLIGNVTELALEAIASGQTAVREDPKRLQQELERVRQKREMMMDAYFSREISREDMISFTEKYDRQQTNLQKRMEEAKNRKDQNLDSAGLRSRIHSELSAILKGETESEVFYKAILESLTVFQDRHMELRLNWLPQVFHFLG